MFHLASRLICMLRTSASEDFNFICDIVTSSGSYLKCRDLGRLTSILDMSSSSSPPSSTPSPTPKSTLRLVPGVSSVASIYQCLFNCGRSFTTLSWMQRHMRLECAEKQEPAVDHCNESLASTTDLRNRVTDK